MSISDLPALNATLNATATLLLVAAYVLIKQGRRQAHKRCMLGALTVSALFLTSYVVYHYNAGSRPYQGQGPLRTVYFLIRPHRPLDVPALAVCLGHRRRDLLDALPDVKSAWLH
jgi:uncharacterized membrane protein YozB (DUF420 family)